MTEAAIYASDKPDFLLDAGERALSVEGDIATSRRHFEHGYRRAETTGDTTALAQAALGLAGLWLHSQETVSARTLIQERLRIALSTINPESTLATRIRLRLAAETSYGRGDPTPILTAIDAAVGRLDPIGRAEALHLGLQCLLAPEQAGLRHVMAAELLSESFRTGRYGDLALSLLWQTVDRFATADPTAERLLVELTDQLDQKDHGAVRYVAQAIEVMRTIRAGRFDQAETLAEECARLGVEIGDVDAEAWYRAHLVTIRWYQGRLAELLPVLREMPYSPALSPVDSSGFAALAVAQAQSGDHRAASSLARLYDLAALPRSGTWMVTMYGVVEAAYLLDDAATAEAAYPLLAPYADLPMMCGLAVACFGSTQHALGVAALTMGDVDRAVEHLRLAVRRNLAIGHWPAVVTSRTRYAEALRRRGLPDDLEAAKRELTAAEHEAASLKLSTPASSSAVLTRQGRRWQVAFGTRTTLVGHSVGVAHLALLLANPGQEISAVELVSGQDVLGDEASCRSAQPMLDQVAVADYKNRLAVLESDIAEFDADNDLERAARARAERDWLLAELQSAAGLAGRPRAFRDDRERARISVGKAIRRAIGRIQEIDAVIGDHLRLSVRTGTFCSYSPA